MNEGGRALVYELLIHLLCGPLIGCKGWSNQVCVVNQSKANMAMLPRLSKLFTREKMRRNKGFRKFLNNHSLLWYENGTTRAAWLIVLCEGLIHG